MWLSTVLGASSNNYLDMVDECLCRDDCVDQESSANFSLDGVRTHYERVLDEIMSSLFLRKRHAKVMGLLPHSTFNRLSFLPEAPS